MTNPTVIPPTQEELDQARDIIERLYLVRSKDYAAIESERSAIGILPLEAAVRQMRLAERLRAMRLIREELAENLPNLTIRGAHR